MEASSSHTMPVQIRKNASDQKGVMVGTKIPIYGSAMVAAIR